MLVLSRKVGSSIMIDDQIEVTVIAVEGDAVKLGISAPSNIEIYRKELYLQIKESNLQATVPSGVELKNILDQYKKK